MEVHNVVARIGNELAQPHSGGKVERIADRERMTLDALAPRALPQPSARIAREFGMMSTAQQPERQAEHLRLAAGESEFGIDPENTQWARERLVLRSISHRKRGGAVDQWSFNFGGCIQIVIRLRH